MSQSKSVIQYFKQRIPQTYRLIAFLVISSVVGVLLLFFAVYNTSRDLEIIHEVDNLHRFAKATLGEKGHADELTLALLNTYSDDYQVLVLHGPRVTYLTDNHLHARFPINVDKLEQYRVNEHGGYVETEDKGYTWVKLPLNGNNKYVVLIHQFIGMPLSQLVQVYLKRLLVPGIFYVWLMVWVGLILRHLTHKLIAQNEKLEHLALHDSLTGLPNRVLLEDRLNKMIQEGQRNQHTFALAVIDLNKFKQVNDTLGHDQGDELLCLVAERIGDRLRSSDTVARIGGDEFVLLLQDVNEESCVCKCESIKDAILLPYVLREGKVTIELSIGISMFPQHGDNVMTLMRNADMAMYSIKSKGGGIQVYREHQGK